MTDTISAELAFAAESELGEGPFQDVATGTLVWLDVLAQRVHWSDPAPGITTTLELELTPGALALRSKAGLIAAVAGGFAALDEHGQLEMLVPVESDKPENRMNDGKCAPDGSFGAGTMARDECSGAGTLYRLAPDLQTSVVLTGLTVWNGLDWAPDGRGVYYIDTADRRIDLLTQSGPGDMWSRQPLIDIDSSLGSPDDLCVDAEGNIWVAMCFGGRVLCYSPDGLLRASVQVPVTLTTLVAFGGDALDQLFITTGRTTLSAEQLRSQPLAGSVFVAHAPTTGLPPTSFGG